ncbi:cytochrome c maturation protein CcmE [Marinicellulosiphila megalodicopiae]|uniref:cytochrome c maturation protein CcmE n=1 Tax=Marinicellulosiphila megalodicopiae TaxID=2724896 RepID=UPI003BAF5E7D
MNPVRKQRLMIVLSVMIGVSIAIGLMVFGFKKGFTAFYTPVEASTIAPLHKSIKVGGMVKAGSIKEGTVGDSKKLVISFIIYDDKEETTVHYTGLLPDLFAENEMSIASGKLNDERILIADKVLAKHDENYVPKEIMDNYGEQHETK